MSFDSQTETSRLSWIREAYTPSHFPQSIREHFFITSYDTLRSFLRCIFYSGELDSGCNTLVMVSAFSFARTVYLHGSTVVWAGAIRGSDASVRPGHSGVGMHVDGETVISNIERNSS